MIPISCKITNFPLICSTMIPIVKLQTFLILVCSLFGNNYNISELTSATSKEKMTMNIIFAGATPIN